MRYNYLQIWRFSNMATDTDSYTPSSRGWWNNFPEFQIEGYWTCSIANRTGNKFTNTPNVKNLGNYIQSITIPQTSLSLSVNDYGLIDFEDKSSTGDVTITFYDDLQGNLLSYFYTWLNGHIYRLDKNWVAENWRYEGKNITVTYYRKLSGGDVNCVKYELQNCIIKEISEISAEEDVGDRKTFTVNLTCERAINKFGIEGNNDYGTMIN